MTRDRVERAICELGYIDFPAAWQMQREGGIAHARRCSSVPGWHPMSGPALLCDCGALAVEFARRRVELLRLADDGGPA